MCLAFLGQFFQQLAQAKSQRIIFFGALHEATKTGRDTIIQIRAQQFLESAQEALFMLQDVLEKRVRETASDPCCRAH